MMKISYFEGGLFKVMKGYLELSVPVREVIWWEDEHLTIPGEMFCGTIIGHPTSNGRNYYFRDEATMTLLIPDQSRQNQEDFIWALPIERAKWNKWYELCKKLNTKTPHGMRYMKRKEGEKVETILVMPHEKQSDDDAMVACAYLRMVGGMTCRMYVVRCSDDASLTGAKLINAVMGMDRDTLHEVDEDSINEDIAKFDAGVDPNASP